jgi:hypothetical protein
MVLTTIYKNAELGRAFLVFALLRELSRLVSRSFLDLKYRAVARAVVRAVACAAALLIFALLGFSRSYFHARASIYIYRVGHPKRDRQNKTIAILVLVYVNHAD